MKTMSTQKPDLRTAAQAVIDRWETPKWKDAPATAGYIAALRDALAAERTAAGQEPVADRAFLERTLSAMEGVIDVADRQTVEFDALRSCVIDLTLMLFKAAPTPPAEAQKPIGVVESATKGVGGFHVRMAEGSTMPSVGTKLYAAPQPAVAAGWVSVDDRLPEPGKPVLLDIGKKFPIRAMWAAKHTVAAHDEADSEWTEYDEATDQHYCPQGWYEWNEHEDVHWAVNQTPRAWCELHQPLHPAPSTEGESA